MDHLIVVNNPAEWNLEITGAKVVSARKYLTDPSYSDLTNVKVYNLCRSYRYQSTGYYVSLLASARGHKPLPNIATIQDMKSQTIIRFVSDDLDDLIQHSLAPIKSDSFVLSIYFGRNLAKRHERLSSHLFSMFQAPFVRAHFEFDKNKWHLRSVGPVPASEIPIDHKSYVVQVAKDYFEGKRIASPKRFVPRYNLAILYNPDEVDSPSDEKALQKFIKAGEQLGIGCELIRKEDFSRIAEFDALFIRETTNVNHYTYRFARKATAEGLVVIDDPDSILKCTNKVYLAELLYQHEIPSPKTMIVHKDNVDKIASELGFPCILKQPDGSFSTGVIKVSQPEDLDTAVEKLMDKSDLIIAQEFMPTDYDWRIGIIDQKPIFACKYFMAKKHWQIIKRDGAGKRSFGQEETMPVELVPKIVIKTALKIANLMGDGLYGVDLKQVGSKCFVIEVNDNPNIDAGVEDSMLKDELYVRIMQVFLNRIEEKKQFRRG